MTIFTEILCDSHERAARPQVISQISDELFYKGFPQRCDYKLKLWEISHTTLHSKICINLECFAGQACFLLFPNGSIISSKTINALLRV